MHPDLTWLKCPWCCCPRGTLLSGLPSPRRDTVESEGSERTRSHLAHLPINAVTWPPPGHLSGEADEMLLHNRWKPCVFLNQAFAGPRSTWRAVSPHSITDVFWNWPPLMAILEGPLPLDYWIIAHGVSVLSQDPPPCRIRWQSDSPQGGASGPRVLSKNLVLFRWLSLRVGEKSIPGPMEEEHVWKSYTRC